MKTLKTKYMWYYKNSFGHGTDLERMQITREELARKLEDKIPIETILDQIRDTFTDKLEMFHLLTHKGLLNLKVEYNISSDGILDTNHVISVACRKGIENLRGRGNSSIILFKDQNIANEDLYLGMRAEDFLLLIMNSS
ncbi:hypothetical protein NPIL_495331 [Nephila pilipes]|uniref:Uncharacterized protein n=1 Tax=Nephila pilipes TaxID=299642 RepID=A0A8X6UL53_NEPPI|nr:hypothetical protein NPIL_495331 [Nephila pilipes]